MASWFLNLVLDDAPGSAPRFVQIARAITDAVQAGRLRPGARLPGTRALARSLGVHRNTAVAAYDELAAEGWIEAAHGRGTFVSPELPSTPIPREVSPGIAARAGFAMAPAPRLGIAPSTAVPRGAINLTGGLPDLGLAPVDELARAYRRAARRGGGALLDYGDPRGCAVLRAALAEMVNATRGLAAGPDDVLITRGSQQALSLAAAAVLRPGDAVAVEALGYDDAWSAFRAAGARLVAVPVDRDGLVIERLAAAAERHRLRAVYLTPHHHYPTLAVLSPPRRLALLELARRRRIAVFEDDYDNEFHFSGRPVLPLASADRGGNVIYVGTLSKVLAPGLRLGYAIAPRPVLARMIERRHISDRQGDHVLESAVAELIEDGALHRHIRKMKRVYEARREVLAGALRRRLGGAVRFDLPAGGLALWVETPGLDADAFAAGCRRRGVWFHSARRFALDGRPRQAIRLGFARATEDQIEEACARMAAVARRHTPP